MGSVANPLKVSSIEMVVARRTAVSETSPKLRAELEGIPTYKPGKAAAAGGRWRTSCPLTRTPIRRFPA